MSGLGSQKRRMQLAEATSEGPNVIIGSALASKGCSVHPLMLVYAFPKPTMTFLHTVAALARSFVLGKV